MNWMNLTDSEARGRQRAGGIPRSGITEVPKGGTRILLLAAVILMGAVLPGQLAAQQDTVSQPGTEQQAFEQLRERFESGEIFRARFTHTYMDSFTGDSSSDSGRIWVGREGYKVQTDNETVVVDGETSRVYDSNRNRLIISRYSPEDDDFAPSRLLQGVDSSYVVEQQEWRGDHFYIRLESGDPFALYRQVEISLNKSLVPLRIRATDPADNIISTSFGDGAFLESGGENLFELDPPDDAEVIDMRN